MDGDNDSNVVRVTGAHMQAALGEQLTRAMQRELLALAAARALKEENDALKKRIGELECAKT